MSEKKAKDKSFLQPIGFKITPAKKKKGRKRKSGSQEKRKQAMAELLVFTLATLEKIRLDIFQKTVLASAIK